MKHEMLTQKIIKIFYQVYNELGYGFLERVYQNALYLALKQAGFEVEAQRKIKVWFRGSEVGEYFADLIVNNTVILELKAAEVLLEEHEAQLLNYLRGTEIEIGLLFNFGKKPEIRRKVYDNELKNNLQKTKIRVPSVSSVFQLKPAAVTRIAFKMTLHPGQKEEYLRRHNALWPELADLLHETGIRNYSIFLDESTHTLFGVLDIDQPARMEDLPAHPVMQRWWTYMADIMETNPDHSPVSVPLQEVFYME